MTDNSAFDRFVADHLADDGSGSAHAERLAALIDERTGERRQWPRWLALIKDSPMRTTAHLAVGSPTARVAAILAATLLLAVTLAVAGVAGQRLLAAKGPIVVAQDGSGTVTTIAEAVAIAEEGGLVLITPGTYAEVVVIDKDITLRGDGQREQIVIQNGHGAGSMVLDSWQDLGGAWTLPYAMMVEDNSGRGIVVGGELTATLTGNRSCGNGDNLRIPGDQEFAIDLTNEICEDDAE